jgi:hypothetical protein
LEKSLAQEQHNIEMMKETRKDENYYDLVRKEQDDDDDERERCLNYDKKWEYVDSVFDSILSSFALFLTL